jgi:subtilase family serine protease
VADIGYQQVRYLLGTGLAGSLSPSDLRTHYNVPATATGAGQTIAIIDAPASNNAANDLNSFSTYYKLPLCNTANPCFTQYTMPGAKIPARFTSNDWAGEVALDVEYAHAIAPSATILLVTAKSSAIGDMVAAVQYAATQPGVVAISMSWGINEGLAATAANDNILKAIQAQGIALIASSGDTGDNGSNNEWPAVSPYVTSVGGTSIKTVGYSLPTVATEVAWSLGGGGVSTMEAMPAFQSSFISASEKALDPNAKRLVPDVSYNADTVASPVVTMVNGSWSGSGGTSAGAPQWAAIVALVAQGC